MKTRREIRSLTTTTTETRHYLELPRSAVLEALMDRFHIPHNAELYMQVPGGADWSNTELHLEEEDQPLLVRWTVKKMETL